MPHTKAAIRNIRKIKTLGEIYAFVDSLEFQLRYITPEKKTVLLAIPENWADRIISLFYSRLSAGH